MGRNEIRLACKRVRAKYGNPCSKMFEFESSDRWIAEKFEQLLIFSRIPIVEEEIMDYYEGCSFIKFMSTKEERIRIEYIFRILISLKHLYLMNLDGYQGNSQKIREEGYMII